MAGRLYILCGAPGCGKMTLLNKIAAFGEKLIDLEIKAIRAPKFSERDVRINPEEIDDITHVPEIRLGDFDVAYIINNNKYGIKLQPIRDLLAKNLNAFIILSDFRVIMRLKSIFGKQAKALYVSSAIDIYKLKKFEMNRLGFLPNDEQKDFLSYHFARISAAVRLDCWDKVSECMIELDKKWFEYADYQRHAETRIQRIRAFHNRYIDYINLFDYVILNYSENKPEEMTEQVRNLIKGIDDAEKFEEKKYPPIFIVIAASNSGKGMLLEKLNFIGSDQIKIISKLAKREFKNKDQRDGMIALQRKPQDPEPDWPAWWTPEMKSIGRNGEFPLEYDIEWQFHKHRDGLSGTKYAVSSHEIQNNVDAGMPQIFISNMDMIKVFRNKWPKNCVFLYLHRLASAHENREHQTKKWKDDPAEAEIRINEKEFVHQEYIKNIALFDHVLLNTGFEEDLYEQIFRLIENYRKNE